VNVEDNLFLANLKTVCNESLILSIKESCSIYAINLVAQEEPNHITLNYFDDVFKAKLRDDPECDILTTLELVIKFITDNNDASSKFVFFCKKGVSRSAALMAGYLMHLHKI
jgi:protein-tyrosine phosphatase